MQQQPHWTQGWRDALWEHLNQPWDIIIIGGGITGAGILREACRLGLHCLLVEQRDFAWGTSSRSSKMIHGGLRYLKEGNVQLIRNAVQERKRLLKDGTGLIQPLGFLLPTYKEKPLEAYSYAAGLTIYDWLASHRQHKHYDAAAFRLLEPHLSSATLNGGFSYQDAQTDDARLVLRIIREAVASGGQALNYAKVEALLWHEDQVVGVRLHDSVADRSLDLTAKIVVNATGAWANCLQGQAGTTPHTSQTPHIRPLRGSHLIFPAWRFPVAQAVAFSHPVDGRSVFACPWEGVILVGATDVDHQDSLDEEAHIHPEEVSYLMKAVHAQYPTLALTVKDIIATYSGIRPIIDTGKVDPSKEGRDYAIWMKKGLLTVAGGKLTIFRLIARDVLKKIRASQRPRSDAMDKQPILKRMDIESLAPGCLNEAVRVRLFGRYGDDALALLALAQPGDLEAIPGTSILWAELRWAAHAEGVIHLEDLLLRRVRLGLVSPQGGRAYLPTIRAICQPVLGWDDTRWEWEEQAYLALWHTHYSLPISVRSAANAL